MKTKLSSFYYFGLCVLTFVLLLCPLAALGQEKAADQPAKSAAATVQKAQPTTPANIKENLRLLQQRAMELIANGLDVNSVLPPERFMTISEMVEQNRDLDHAAQMIDEAFKGLDSLAQKAKESGAGIQPKKISFSSYKDVKVVGNLFLPEQPTKVGFIFGHGGFGNKELWTDLCRAVAQEGIAALSLDFEGCGESEGYTSWIGRIKDFSYAIDFLTKEHGLERFAVAGHSGGGAYPAICAAIDDERITAATLWDCIFDFYEVHIAPDCPDAGGNPACLVEATYNNARSGDAKALQSPQVAEFRHIGEHLDEIFEEIDSTLKHYRRPSEMLRPVQEKRRLAVLHIIADDMISAVPPSADARTYIIPGPAASPVRARFHDRPLRFGVSGLFYRPDGRWKRWHADMGEPKRTAVIPNTTHAFAPPGRQIATRETLEWLKRYLVEQKWDDPQRDSIANPAG